MPTVLLLLLLPSVTLAVTPSDPYAVFNLPYCPPPARAHPAPPSPSAPQPSTAPATPTPSEQVFVPLEEWKQRVLASIHPRAPSPGAVPVDLDRGGAHCPASVAPELWARVRRLCPWALEAELFETVGRARATEESGGVRKQETVVQSEAPMEAKPEAVATYSADRNTLEDVPAAEETDEQQDYVIQARQEERFNFASVDAGARVLAANVGTVGAKNVLSTDKDKYMMSKCRSKETGWGWRTKSVPVRRWIVIELSEEILLKSIEIANYEYYSSSPEKVVFFGAQDYPDSSTEWRKLGDFKYGLRHGLKRFGLQGSPLAQYLKVVFYGNVDYEYYCTISEIRAFGKRLLEDWKDALQPRGSQTANATTQSKPSGESTPPPTRDDAQPRTDESQLSPKQSEEAGSDYHETYSAPSNPKQPQSDDDMNDAEIRKLLSSVAADAFGGSVDDSIFRRVTRMIRMLELNQSLTNHYIDTHLKKYATSLRDTKAEALAARREAEDARQHLDDLATELREVMARARGSQAISSLQILQTILLGLLVAIAAVSLCVPDTPARVRWWTLRLVDVATAAPDPERKGHSRRSRAKKRRASGAPPVTPVTTDSQSSLSRPSYAHPSPGAHYKPGTSRYGTLGSPQFPKEKTVLEPFPRFAGKRDGGMQHLDLG